MVPGVYAFAKNNWLEVKRTDDTFGPFPDGLCFQLVSGSENVSKDQGKCFELPGGVAYHVKLPNITDWSEWYMMSCWSGLCSTKSPIISANISKYLAIHRNWWEIMYRCAYSVIQGKKTPQHSQSIQKTSVLILRDYSALREEYNYKDQNANLFTPTCWPLTYFHFYNDSDYIDNVSL